MKPNKITILAVCGAGVGSSVMMKINAEEVLEKHGIKARLMSSDITSSKGNKADVLVTTKDIFKLIKDIDIPEVVILDNMVSIKELEEKLIPACQRAIEKLNS